jgi:photosystem II oxygen-evolving enhancer protein 2
MHDFFAVGDKKPTDKKANFLFLLYAVCLWVFWKMCSNALGTDVQALGESLATKRNAKLVRAEERITDGILFYVFDFAIKDGTHQLLQLCVNKGRIWSLDANTVEKRWPKREELYYNVIGSFMPKLA